MRLKMTLMTAVLAIIIIFGAVTVTALVLLAMFKSGPINRQGVTGTVEVSKDGSTWGSSVTSSIVDPLYARFRTTATGYAGQVKITWRLVENVTGAEVQVLTEYTTFTLTGNSGDIIYVNATGGGAPGYNWGSYASSPITYYIQADVLK